MLFSKDTIAAIATARGEGGVAIVRISGTDAKKILQAAFQSAVSRDFSPNHMVYGHVLGALGEVLDEALAVYFKAPHSYTREDVVELQCHGGDECARRVLARVLALGARAAEPGEFTKRAFLNGRLDLSEAEAVMSLISARSEGARRAALRQLQGGVSREISEIAEQLKDMLALIEAGDDFPEEIDELAAADTLRPGICAMVEALSRAADPQNARRIQDGVSVALIGRPNTGKSSLLNALLKAERAIVTDIPGTTRDVLTEELRVGGIRIMLSDTAGLRETDDRIEQIGVNRALARAREADAVLLVLDGAAPLTARDTALLAQADARYLIVLNKMDLGAGFALPDALAPVFSVSAKTGAGLDALLDALLSRARAPETAGFCLVQERHIELAQKAVVALARADETLRNGLPIDLCAVDLQEALQTLLEIGGETASEAVIERVFANFCVGK